MINAVVSAENIIIIYCSGFAARRLFGCCRWCCCLRVFVYSCVRVLVGGDTAFCSFSISRINFICFNTWFADVDLNQMSNVFVLDSLPDKKIEHHLRATHLFAEEKSIEMCIGSRKPNRNGIIHTQRHTQQLVCIYFCSFIVSICKCHLSFAKNEAKIYVCVRAVQAFSHSAHLLYKCCAAWHIQ